MSVIDKIREKLDSIVLHNQAIEKSLSDPQVVDDLDRYRKLSKDFADSGEVCALYREFQSLEKQIENIQGLLKDPEMEEVAREEEIILLNKIEETTLLLQKKLLPKSPDDERNAILEIRAGTGGDESGIFAGDLYRMYYRFAERERWKVEILSSSEAEVGGYKEIIVRIEGKEVYGKLKFESGGHRVQRVPDTETQGRIHTSACTVAVLPEIPETEVDINPADLRIDVYRASGAGGQHVNKTESAIRITHIPTGVVVECQDDRSQHRNRARALSILASRLQEAQKESNHQQEASTRKLLIGSGDRSQRIRTYNFPQGRMTDHRINLTLYKLPMIMDGDLADLISALSLHHQADILEESLNDKN